MVSRIRFWLSQGTTWARELPQLSRIFLCCKILQDSPMIDAILINPSRISRWFITCSGGICLNFQSLVRPVPVPFPCLELQPLAILLCDFWHCFSRRHRPLQKKLLKLEQKNFGRAYRYAICCKEFVVWRVHNSFAISTPFSKSEVTDQGKWWISSFIGSGSKLPEFICLEKTPAFWVWTSLVEEEKLLTYQPST